MIYPLLPLFVVTVLARPRRMGWIRHRAGTRGADRVGRCAATGSPPPAVVRRRPARDRQGDPRGRDRVAARAARPHVDRVGKGFRGSPRDALIVDATPRRSAATRSASIAR
jgi:hypothetical protein